jgi:dTDP-4-amino-4,6-dideoxy-D-galactose acyltransferase
VKSFTDLDWDSSFFGFRVARINPKTLNATALKKIIEQLREHEVTLAYWSPDCSDTEAQAAGYSADGCLADKKITYVSELSKLLESPVRGSGQAIEYEGDANNLELEELAIQSGIYSRFKIDPMFPDAKFRELYRTWMRKSISGELADAVFVIPRTDGKIIGMVTVGHTNGRGQIGLIAVAPGERGKGYGRILMGTAHKFLKSSRYEYSQVVTQMENVSACRLYEICGYQAEKCENVFHFWLQ